MNGTIAPDAADALQEISAFREVMTEMSRRHWPRSTALAQSEALNGPDDDALWAALVTAGAPVLALAERAGGLGAGSRGCVAVVEEAAAGLQPGGLLATNGLVAPVLNALSWTSARDRAADLGRRLAGGARASTAWVEHALPTRDVEVSFEASSVLEADRAEFVLIIAGQGSQASIVLVEDPPGVSRRRVDGYDPTRRFSDLSGRLTIPESDVLLTGSEAGAVASSAFLGAAVAVAADAAGGARAATRDTVDYAISREQFGKPIGSFQALRHLIVDTHVRVEQAAAATAFAAGALDAGTPDALLYVHIAKALACEAYILAASTAVQVHGGIGFTRDVTAHLHVKRARADEFLFAPPTWHRARIADLLERQIPDDW